MLVTFKSKAAAEIYMYPEHAHLLLDIVGKEYAPQEAPRGVITVEQLPQAIAALKSAVADAKASDEQRRAAAESAEQHPDHPGRDPLTQPVGLSQRAFPLLDMLERAQRLGSVVTWGV